MKIIVIYGNPRKKEGYELLKRLEEKIKTIGDAELEYVFLAEENVKQCKGCHNCIFLGEDKCPLKDDFLSIRDKMLASDGVIFYSPVYVWNVHSLFKNFMDRIAFHIHRPVFFKQKCILFTNGGSMHNYVLRSMSYLSGSGFQIVDKLGITSNSLGRTKNYEARIDKRLDKLAKRFYHSIEKPGKEKPAFVSILFFKVFQKAFDEYKKTFKADYAFYKDKEYYYEIEINPLKDFFAEMLSRPIAKLMFKDFNHSKE